eukprot:XP_001184677.2 PREDICTED: proactivator polypeptide [Strongylocentrotus purpuratus]
MNTLVIFAALFAAASAINPAAIYRSQCSEGASYWCRSASHADECGAVEYCIQNSWKGKLVQESSTCSDCEAFINAVHNVLEQTSIQTEIIDGAKQACVVMDSLSGLCQTLVETLGAEVLQKLVTELNSDEVCKVLQFCQEKTSLETNVNDDEVCTLCKDGMAEANAILSNVTLQQDFENMLLQFCPLLSEIFPNCANFIQDEIPVVIQFLLTYLTPESCSEIGLCPGTVELQNLLVQLKKMKNREGVDLCSTCKTTMTTIDSMLSNSAIQSAIVLGLDQFCSSLGPAAPFCVYAVNHYTKEIIATLVTYLNPDTFCHEFRFCSSDQNAHLGSDMCTDCTTFFGDIDGMLTNQTVQNMILAAVDDICAEFGDFADQCKSYADQYGYIVFDFLASQLSPQEICTDISFCPATPETKTKKLALTADSCTDCKAFFGDIDSMLMNVTVENMITAEILQVCSQFGSFADQCKSYVSQYAPLVYSLLASELNPDQICSTLTFCPAQMALKVKV